MNCCARSRDHRPRGFNETYYPFYRPLRYRCLHNMQQTVLCIASPV